MHGRKFTVPCNLNLRIIKGLVIVHFGCINLGESKFSPSLDISLGDLHLDVVEKKNYPSLWRKIYGRIGRYIKKTKTKIYLKCIINTVVRSRTLVHLIPKLDS
jgi:hypothetical protein